LPSYKLVTADDFTAKTELTGLISGGALQLSIHATGDLSGGNGSMTEPPTFRSLRSSSMLGLYLV